MKSHPIHVCSVHAEKENSRLHYAYKKITRSLGLMLQFDMHPLKGKQEITSVAGLEESEYSLTNSQ